MLVVTKRSKIRERHAQLFVSNIICSLSFLSLFMMKWFWHRSSTSHLQHWDQHFTVRTFYSRSRRVKELWYFWTLWSLLLSTVTYRQRSLQFAGDCAEAVEHKVFAHAVDPLAAGRQSAADKVTTFPLTGAETPHDLHGERHRCI